jgi:hypothetical protein
MWLAQYPTPAIFGTLLAKRQFMFALLVKDSLENLAMWQVSLSGAL